MKGFLNNRRISCLLSALCFIALGVFLVGWPDLSRIWICRVLGAALLAAGGVCGYTVCPVIGYGTHVYEALVSGAYTGNCARQALIGK